MEYANIVLGGSCNTDLDKLERVNIAAMRRITGGTSNCNINKLYDDTGFITMRDGNAHIVF